MSDKYVDSAILDVGPAQSRVFLLLCEADKAQKVPVSKVHGKLEVFSACEVPYDDIRVVREKALVCNDGVVNNPALRSGVIHDCLHVVIISSHSTRKIIRVELDG